MVKLNGHTQTKNYRDFEDAIEHSNGYFYLVSDDLVAHNAKAKVYKFNSKGKKFGEDHLEGDVQGKNLNLFLRLLMEN